MSEQITTTPTPEETGGKLFTQEQVNDIVRDRLAKERAKPPASDRERDLEAREKAFADRVRRQDCTDWLKSAHYAEPHIAAMLELFPEADVEQLKAEIGKLEKAGFRYSSAPRRTGMNHESSSPVGGSLDSDIADAFKPKRRK